MFDEQSPRAGRGVRPQTHCRWTTSVAAAALLGAAAAALPAAPVPDTASQVSNTARPAQEPQEVIGRGELRLDEPVIDFGEMWDTENRTRVVGFTNTGDGPLIVQELSSTCGCTVPRELEKKVYMPGESGTIEVGFEPNTEYGRQDREVVIITRNTDEPRQVLRVAALVRRQVIVEPPIGQLGELIRGSGEHKSVEIAVASHMERFRAPRATVSADSPFTVERLGTEVRKIGSEGEGFFELPVTRYRVTLRDDAEVGVVEDSLLIRTNHPDRRLVGVALVGRVVGDLVATPSVVTLGTIDAQETREVELTVRSRSGKPFEITRATEEEEGLGLLTSFRVAPGTGGSVWQLTVKATAGSVASRPRATLRLNTTAGDGSEVLEVRFSGALGR